MPNLIRRRESEQPAVTSGRVEWDPYAAMRELMRWDPFAEMTATGFGGTDSTFMPRFDVKETNDGYEFRADLPGVKEEDLDIELAGNRLTISGKRDYEERREDEAFYCYERSHGSFRRSFTLPDEVNLDGVEAELKNGELCLTVPKAPEHLPKKVSLKGIAEKAKAAVGKVTGSEPKKSVEH